MAREGLDSIDRGTHDGVDAVQEERRDVGSQLPVWLLRCGLTFAFLYAAGASFLHPTTFARYFPSFLPVTWAEELLPAFAVFEVVLAGMLLTSRFTYVASLTAAATLVGIVIANPDAFEVLFRNVALACAALALALLHRQEQPTTTVPAGDGDRGPTRAPTSPKRPGENRAVGPTVQG